MAYQNNDIEKYLSGELTPAEMHALEQNALKDPFLAEALEGIENLEAEKFADDIRLIENSIKDKTRKRLPKTITLNGWNMYMGIAAGLLLLVLSYFIVVLLIKENKKQDLSEANETPVAKQNPNQGTDSLISLNKIQPADIVEDKIEKNSELSANKAQKNKVRPEEVESDKHVVASDPIIQTESSETESKPSLQISSEKEEYKEHAISIEDADRKKTSIPSEPLSSSALPGEIVRGRVVSQDDHAALPGVNVVLKGTNIGTVTDVNGNYELKINEQKGTLVFAFIGFTSKEIDIKDKANIDVALEADMKALSEVVVVGYGAINNTEAAVVELALPVGGKKRFKKYLEENIVYPTKALEQRIEGKVTVQFTVQPSGQLTDFQILKGIGYGCDEELIRLIREGPKWEPSKRNSHPVIDQVKIRFNFSLPSKK